MHAGFCVRRITTQRVPETDFPAALFRQSSYSNAAPVFGAAILMQI